MADRSVDVMVLLGNNAVVYATGTSWPLGDSGLSHVERPVAVVLADDEWPHLFLPFREGASQESELPADHLHGPVYLEFDEGVENFARRPADLIPPGAVIAVDTSAPVPCPVRQSYCFPTVLLSTRLQW